MTKHPLVNAAAAFAYIVGVVCLITYGLNGGGEGIIFPVLFLSLLVLSVLMMGYTLLLAPLQLFFEKEVRAGVKLFVQTLGFFAGIVAIVILLVLFVF